MIKEHFDSIKASAETSEQNEIVVDLSRSLETVIKKFSLGWITEINAIGDYFQKVLIKEETVLEKERKFGQEGKKTENSRVGLDIEMVKERNFSKIKS